MIIDSIIVGTGICVFLTCMYKYWKVYSLERFTAKLKHGDKWHKQLGVKEYSFYGAKLWLKKYA